MKKFIPNSRILRRRSGPLHSAAKVLLAGMLLGSISKANANLISNGSFEDPQVSPGFHGVTPTSWTGGAFLFNGGFSGWPTAEDGAQYEDIGLFFSPALAQPFHVSTAGTYLLTWSDNAYTGLSSAYDVSVLEGASSVAGGNFNFVGAPSWNERSMSLNLDVGDYSLRFQSQGRSGADSLLDNVSLTQTPASSVPESSSSLLLLSLGTSGMGLCRLASKRSFIRA